MQLIFRKVADVLRERELYEKRKNDPPLEIPSDHPLRKLISRFRKRSDPNLIYPSSGGETTLESGGDRATTPRNGTKDLHQENGVEIRSLYERKKSIASVFGVGACDNQEYNHSARNSLKETLLNENTRLRLTPILGPNKLRAPLAAPGSARRPSKWGAVFGKQAEHEQQKQAAIRAVTPVPVNEATAGGTNVVTPLQQSIVFTAPPVEEKEPSVEENSAKTVKPLPLMAMLRKVGAIKAPVLNQTICVQPQSIEKSVTSSKIRETSDDGTTRRVESNSCVESSSIQQLVLTSLTDLRGDIRMVNTRLHSVESRLEDIVRQFGQKHLSGGGGLSSTTPIVGGPSTTPLQRRTDFRHENERSRKSRFELSPATSAECIRSAGGGPVVASGNFVTSDSHFSTPAQAATMADIAAATAAKHARYFAASRWKEEQQMSTASVESDRSTGPLLKRSSTPELGCHQPSPIIVMQNQPSQQPLYSQYSAQTLDAPPVMERKHTGETSFTDVRQVAARSSSSSSFSFKASGHKQSSKRNTIRDANDCKKDS